MLPDNLTSGLMLVEPTFIAVGLAIGTIAVSSALFDVVGSLSRHRLRINESCDAEPVHAP